MVVIKSGKDPQGKDKIPKTWIPLKDMKESHSLEITEFAMAHRLNNKLPAFNWWVGHTLKKRSSIIASIKTRMAKTTQILSMPRNRGHSAKSWFFPTYDTVLIKRRKKTQIVILYN